MPLALVAVGGVLVWSGVENEPVTAIFRSLSAGKAPAKGPVDLPDFYVTTAGTSSLTDNEALTGNLPTGATGSAAANQAIARMEAAPYGWATGQEWADLVSLWNRESGWSNTAQNPTSTAYGIAQFLDTTWAPYGPKTSSATLQIKYGLEYIRDRYGSPSAAWAHEESAGWY